eukprot:COSAG02_NODE_22468_length_751_cov_3.349693_1_plen_147_part_00
MRGVPYDAVDCVDLSAHGSSVISGMKRFHGLLSTGRACVSWHCALGCTGTTGMWFVWTYMRCCSSCKGAGTRSAVADTMVAHSAAPSCLKGNSCVKSCPSSSWPCTVVATSTAVSVAGCACSVCVVVKRTPRFPRSAGHHTRPGPT